MSLWDPTETLDITTVPEVVICWWQSKGFCSPSGRPDGPDMWSGGASWVAAVSTLHTAGL